jgi:hypothetical protein
MITNRTEPIFGGSFVREVAWLNKICPLVQDEESCEEVSQLTISCPPLGPAAWSQSAPPLPACHMTGAHDFVTGLARAFGGQDSSKNRNLQDKKKVKPGEKAADLCHLNRKKKVQTAALITSMASTVEGDRCVTMGSLAAAHETCLHPIHRLLRENLDLER